MAVSKPPLTSALNNWQQRASQYAQLGIPQSQWYQLAVNDIQNVSNNGATPLSTSQVNAAMAAQYAGHTLIGNPTPHPKGFWGDLANIVTSIPHDIGGLITGFLPGMAHFIMHLPSEVTNTEEMLAHSNDDQWLSDHGYDTYDKKSFLSQLAVTLRNFSKSPVLNLLPGVADLADLTTSQGREWMLNHPVTTALDVAPAGKLLGHATSLLPEAEAGSALEAAQVGRPVVAGLRGLSAASSKIPGLADLPLTKAETWRNLANMRGLGPDIQAIFNKEAHYDRTFTAKVQDFVNSMGNDILKMPLEERDELFQENAGLKPIASPEHEAILTHLRQLSNDLLKHGQERYRNTRGKDGLIVTKYGKGRLVFSATDPIKRHIARMNRLTSTHLPSVRRKMQQTMRGVAKHQAMLDKLTARIDEDRRNGQPIERLLREREAVQAKLTTAKARLARLETVRKGYQRVLAESRSRFHEELYSGSSEAKALRPRITADTRTALEQWRTGIAERDKEALAPLNDPTHPHYDPTTYQARLSHQLKMLEDDLSTLHHANTFTELKRVFEQNADREGHPNATKAAKEQFEAIQRDVIKNVLNLVSKGFDPIWLKHIDPGRERFSLRVKVLPDHIADITQYNRTTFNFAPMTHDLALGLMKAASDLYRGEGTEQFMGHVTAWGKTTAEIKDEFLKLAMLHDELGKRLATHDISGLAQKLQNDEWTPIHPESYGLRTFGGRFTQLEEMWIPKWLANNLEKMMPKYVDHNSLSLHGAYDRALHVFRFSVLTGPRHLVHVAVAGLVPLMLREPTAPAYFHRAYRMIKDKSAPVDLMKHIYDFTDGIYGYSVGKQYGQWLTKGWEMTGKKVRDGIAHLEELSSDMYRVSAMLAAEHRGIERESAIAIANKVAVNMDDLAPWERTIVKQVFPFYGFTRFLFRYLLTYPVDHPYRVAILSRFATQEQEEWNSLIPQKFMQTLFLGTPDSHGNIKTIDLRNLNPFRSFSNDFTMVGFFQSLSPFFSAPFAMRGFDTLTGVGPLYPSLEFNPSTGTLQAAPPSGRDELFNTLSQFIPEVGTLDHFVGITDRMRVLKKTDPAAYKSMLYSQLNLPGVLSPPITVNLPYLEEKAEMDRYQAASQAVSQAEEGKQPWSKAEQFSLVPYQGQLVDPTALANYWQQLLGESGGVNPRATLATPIHKTSQDPLEILNELGYIPQAQSTEGL